MTGLAGARGNDGVTATRIRANPSDDDVMTREYRHGDPMRRVHWAATARHGELMVRQEESVTTPEATIILDQRSGGLFRRLRPRFRRERLPWTAMRLGTSAARSSGQLWRRCPSARTCRSATTPCALLDPDGEPAFLRSPSAPEPEAEEYSGTAGLQSIAESLAAIQLSGTAPRRAGTARRPGRARCEGHGGHDSGPDVFDDQLMDKLSAHRMRGPIIAAARQDLSRGGQGLGAGAGYGANAFAIIVTDRPTDSEEALETLRRGGWRAVRRAGLGCRRRGLGQL